MNPMAIFELIKLPVAKIIGIAAMLAAVFFAGYTTSNAFCRAEKAETESQNNQAVANQAIAIVGHAKESQIINTEVSNYAQTRTADFARRLGVGLRHPNSYRAMPSFSGGATGSAAGGPGCISAEQYNDLAWEAGATAVMVEAWQLWYAQQRDAYNKLIDELHAAE